MCIGLGCCGMQLACCGANAFWKLLLGAGDATGSFGSSVASAILFVLYGLFMLSAYKWADGLHMLVNSSYTCKDDDSTCIVYMNIWLMGLALTVYHGVMAIVMLGARKKSSILAKLNDGFWAFKFILLLVLGFCSVFLTYSFVSVFYIPVFIAGALYVLLQAALLVDAAYNWSEDLVDVAEDDMSNYADVAKFTLVGSTVLMLGGLLAAIIILYVYFRDDLELSLTTIALVLVLLMHGCSLIPRIQEANPSAGLFQAATLSCYAIYLVGAAFIYEGIGSKGTTSVFMAHPKISLVVSIFSFIFLLISIVRGALRLGGEHAALHELAMPTAQAKDDLFSPGPAADDDEADIGFSYTMQHISFALAACYLTLTLTHWQFAHLADVPHSGKIQIELQNKAMPFWIRIGSSWVTALMYLWSLVAPLILDDRRFY